MGDRGGLKTTLLVLAATVISMTALTGCFTNNLGTELSLGKSTVEANSPNLGDGDDEAVILTLTRVVPANVDPGQYLELVGDGSGAIGRTCTSTSGNNSPEGASKCTCHFEYTPQAGAIQKFDADTVYHEEDRIRCPYTRIDLRNVSEVKVKIHIPTEEAFSNEITFKFSTAFTTLDITDPNSFLPAKRYQCKDILFVNYLFSKGAGQLYDPFLSEDPLLREPLNFYTTNFGGTIASFVTNEQVLPANGGGWDCPSSPEVTDAIDIAAMNVYSRLPDANGDKLIYKHGRRNPRAEFHLAREKSGVFNIPVNAWVAPGTVTDSDPSTHSPPPLGYAAAPIITANDEESCPDTVAIPPGYQWVKIWPFRASLAARIVPANEDFAKINYIACDPGLKTDDPADGSIVKDCIPAAAFSLEEREGTDLLASRAVVGNNGAGECVNPASGPAPAADGYGLAGMVYSGSTHTFLQEIVETLVPNGSDWWEPILSGGPLACNDGAKGEQFLNLCTIHEGVSYSIPNSNKNIDMSIDKGARSDFLLTVSPPTVNTSDMLSENTRAQPYIPYRFRTGADCKADDPANPGANGPCDAQRKVLYRFNAKDLTLPDSSPDNDPTHNRFYPLCALQPVL